MDEGTRTDVAGDGGTVTDLVGASMIGGLAWLDLVFALTALVILATAWVVMAAGTGRLEVTSADEVTQARTAPERATTEIGGGWFAGEPSPPVRGPDARPPQSRAASAAS